jgi:hypothetical protein
MRVALLVIGLTQSACDRPSFLDNLETFKVKDVPGIMRDNLRILKTGTGAIWRNRKAAAVLRKRHKSEGTMPTYPELLLLRQADGDTQKLIRAGVVYLAFPEAFAVMLASFPNSMPSTFETEARRRRRYEGIAQMRVNAVLQMLIFIETQAVVRKGTAGRLAVERSAEAEQLLRASSLPAAAAPLAKYLHPATSAQAVEVSKAPLKGMSGRFVTAGSNIIGISGSGPIPPFIRRQGLKRHLQQVRQPRSTPPPAGACVAIAGRRPDRTALSGGAGARSRCSPLPSPREKPGACSPLFCLR